jgi:hypothetical protein
MLVKASPRETSRPPAVAEEPYVFWGKSAGAAHSADPTEPDDAAAEAAAAAAQARPRRPSLMQRLGMGGGAGEKDTEKEKETETDRPGRQRRVSYSHPAGSRPRRGAAPDIILHHPHPIILQAWTTGR